MKCNKCGIEMMESITDPVIIVTSIIMIIGGFILFRMIYRKKVWSGK